jgi:diguanylate cyclase (GGDEF)-like protein
LFMTNVSPRLPVNLPIVLQMIRERRHRSATHDAVAEGTRVVTHSLASGLLSSRLTSLIAALALLCSIGFVDVATGYEIGLGLFYLLPVALATWRVGLLPGLFLSILSAIGMFIVDNFLTRDIPFPSSDWIPYWNTGIRLGYLVVFTSVLAALKRAHERERSRARRDFLTQAANAETFADMSRIELERARRYQLPVSFAYIDCDDFKQINDRFGHQTGDQLLKVVAATLTEGLRRSDVVARLGGDEFAVLLPDTPSQPAQQVFHALQAELLHRMRKHGWPVTFSIGIATFVTPPETPEELIELSDALMYAVKRNGKNMIKHHLFD